VKQRMFGNISLAKLERILREADRAHQEAIELTRTLVQFDTTNTGDPSSGNETQVARYLASYLRREGFSDILLVARARNRDNLIATLRGRSRTCGMLFLSHSDVVPAGDSKAWKVPPFQARLQGGRVFGRGVADMKGTLVAQLFALLVINRLKIPLKHSIRFICAADEEAGGRFGTGWLRARHPSLLKALLAFNEGGGECYKVDEHLYYGVPCAEKGRYEATLLFRGTGAHAAMPWRGNSAIGGAAEFVRRLAINPPKTTPLAGGFAGLRHVIGVFPSDLKSLEHALSRLGLTNEPLASEIRANTRMTITPTIIRGGTKSNSVPDLCSVICDARTLPHQGRSAVLNYLRMQIANLPAQIKVSTTADPTATKLSSQRSILINTALDAALGERVHLFPTLTVGYTDSRFARDLGTPVINFTPYVPGSSEGQENIHGPNESMRTQDLNFRVRFYAAAIGLWCSAL
jgi:acetylornithine deacetylase/succinyl-diaminopimelate desuccinylase-like protein